MKAKAILFILKWRMCGSAPPMLKRSPNSQPARRYWRDPGTGPLPPDPNPLLLIPNALKMTAEEAL